MARREPEYIGRKTGGAMRFKPPQLSVKAYLGLAVLFLVLVGLAVPYFMFLEYVRPNEYGIKEIKVGVNRGIQERVYEPGYVLVVPFMQMIHRLPQQVQVLELTDPAYVSAAHISDSVHHEKRPANIQTSDGFYVDVDVSILYRITDPYKVITSLGPGDRYLHQGILPKAEPFLKQTLGLLTPEEFYNSPLRVEKTQLARDQLNAEMQHNGITVDHVLVRYFKYSDAIQENIEERKLQDQLVFTNQSLGLAAAEERNLNRITAQGEMQVRITHQEGDAYRVRKESERDLYVRSKTAEADLLVELAEAKRTELRNAAMQEIGSNRLVAMQMAEVLRGLDSIVIPTGGVDSLNPLDLDAMLTVFGGAGALDLDGSGFVVDMPDTLVRPVADDPEDAESATVTPLVQDTTPEAEEASE